MIEKRISFGIFKKDDTYKVVKRQKPAYDKKRKDLKEMNLLVERENVPISINVYKKMREFMCNRITSKYNTFKLCEGYTEEEFLKDFEYFYRIEILAKMETD